METEPLVYTAAELTKKLDCSKTTFWAGVNSGKIPNIKLSERKILFPKVMIDKWLSGESQTVKSA